MTDRPLDHIRRRLDQLGLDLSSPLPPKVVERWEHQARLKLPAPYRTFLLEVGGAGAGPPESGLWGLHTTDDPGLDSFFRPNLHRQGATLRKHFPLTEPWTLTLHEHERYLAEDPDLQRRVLATRHGAWTLGTDGCSYFWSLILSGPSRGQVWWNDGMDAFEPRAPDFLTWYTDWLDTRS